MAKKLEQALPFMTGDPLVYVLSSPSSSSQCLRVSVAIEEEQSGSTGPSTFCRQRAVVPHPGTPPPPSASDPRALRRSPMGGGGGPHHHLGMTGHVCVSWQHNADG